LQRREEVNGQEEQINVREEKANEAREYLVLYRGGMSSES
jgi:hypothetical protein